MKSFKKTTNTFIKKEIIKKNINKDISVKLINNLLKIQDLSKIADSKIQLIIQYYKFNSINLFNTYEDIYITFKEYFLTDIEQFKKIFIESYIENFKSPSQRELIEQLPFIFEK